MRLLMVLLLGSWCLLGAQECVEIGPEPGAGPGGGWLPRISSTGAAVHWRKQVLIPDVWFANVPMLIRDVAVGNEYGWLAMEYGQLEVRMGHTSVQTLDYMFANNITSPMQLVLDVDDHRVMFGPGPMWCALGLQDAFQFVPGQGNLLIDFRIVGSTMVGGSVSHSWSKATLSTDYDVAVSQFSTSPPLTSSGESKVALRLCADRAWTNVFGSGCGGAAAPILGLSGDPRLGGSVGFWLSNAGAGLPAALAFGSDNSPPFPFDLGLAGAPGCRQYFGVSSLVGVVANASGFGSHFVQVPVNQALVGAVVFGQYAALAPGANSLGLRTSAYGRIQVGL